jgi:hypothetical protein
MERLADAIDEKIMHPDSGVIEQAESDRIRKEFANFIAGKATPGGDAAEYFTVHTNGHPDVHTDHSPRTQRPQFCCPHC